MLCFYLVLCIGWLLESAINFTLRGKKQTSSLTPFTLVLVSKHCVNETSTAISNILHHFVPSGSFSVFIIISYLLGIFSPWVWPVACYLTMPWKALYLEAIYSGFSSWKVALEMLHVGYELTCCNNSGFQWRPVGEW